MKLVRMPAELLAVTVDDLPNLGVAPRLIDAIAERCAGDPAAIASLALLGPRASGTAPALMVLARTIGAALRDENIRLRDGGGDLRHGRKKLCYLPGSALREALRSADGRSALEGEAAVFIQDLDSAWGEADAPTIRGPEIEALVLGRRERGARTFVSADPVLLPGDVLRMLAANVTCVESEGGSRVTDAPGNRP